MKAFDDDVDTDDEEEVFAHPVTSHLSKHVYDGIKGAWKNFDDRYLKELFGGSQRVRSGANNPNLDGHGHYEMTGNLERLDSDEDDQYYNNGLS